MSDGQLCRFARMWRTREEWPLFGRRPMKNARNTPRNCVLGFAACVVVAISMTFSVHAYACEGQELEWTYQVLHASLTWGYRCGRYQECNTAQLYDISAAAQQLPLSCQQLIERVGEQLQESVGPSGPNCYGGVCCDQSGCVGG